MRHVIFITGIYLGDDNTRPGTPSHLSTMSRTLGVYQLKHWLSKFGIESQVIDFCQWMTIKELLDLIEHFKGPETVAVAFSVSFWPFGTVPYNLLMLINELRQRHPSLKIIAGGSNPSPFPGLFDKRFYGYAEDELVTWVQEQLGKKGRSLFNQKFDITKLDHCFDKRDAISAQEVLPMELGRAASSSASSAPILTLARRSTPTNATSV